MSLENTENCASTPKPPNMAMAVLVADLVEIKSIRVVDMCTWYRPENSSGPLGLKVSSRMEANAYIRDGDKLEVRPRFVLIGVQSAKGNDSLIEVMHIECCFEVEYTLKSSEGLTAEHVDSFGQLNGIYNTWPYWREYVQSATARLGLPALMVPVFRLPASDVETAKNAEHEKNSKSLEATVAAP